MVVFEIYYVEATDLDLKCEHRSSFPPTAPPSLPTKDLPGIFESPPWSRPTPSACAEHFEESPLKTC